MNVSGGSFGSHKDMTTKGEIKGKGFAECFYCMGTGTATDEFGREGECAECGGMGEKIIESSFFDPTWAESKFDPFRKKCRK